MNCYATFLIKWLAAGRSYWDFLLQKNIKPEIGMEHGGLNFPKTSHRELAKELADCGLAAAAHLPFFDVIPGHPDKKLQRQAVDTLLRATEVANIYNVGHLIGHPEFIAPYHATCTENTASANTPDEAWLERSTQAWQEILNATDASLYLENTDDQTPEAILTLLKRLPARASMCFDIGHWFCAANGRDLHNLKDWLIPIAASNRLAHLHLHDNDGEGDWHWAMGRGGIDFTEFFALLDGYGLKPTFTLESHNLDTLKESLRWLDGAKFSRLDKRN